MLSLRRSLIAAASALAILGTAVLPASAVGPSQSNIQIYPKLSTYSAVITALTPAAAGTDIFTLTGSSSKIVTVQRFGCTGTSTAAGSQMVGVYTRTIADTGGTATNPTVMKLDSANAASTAVVAAYTANPTISSSGTFGLVKTGLLQTPAPASIATSNGFYLTGNYTDVTQSVTLRGAAQQVAFSLLGVSGASGIALTCEAVWTEQ